MSKLQAKDNSSGPHLLSQPLLCVLGVLRAHQQLGSAKHACPPDSRHARLACAGSGAKLPLAAEGGLRYQKRNPEKSVNNELTNCMLLCQSA